MVTETDAYAAKYACLYILYWTSVKDSPRNLARCSWLHSGSIIKADGIYGSSGARFPGQYADDLKTGVSYHVGLQHFACCGLTQHRVQLGQFTVCLT